MAVLFAASTGRFYAAALTYPDGVPPDAVKVSPERHAALLFGQVEGKQIVADARGRPQLASPVITRDQLTRAIKREAAARILAVSPDWRQANDLRAVLASGEIGPAAEERFARIDAVRAASDLIEDQLVLTANKALAKFPVADNPYWPTFEGAA